MNREGTRAQRGQPRQRAAHRPARELGMGPQSQPVGLVRRDVPGSGTRAFSELTDSFWDSHGIEFLIQDVGWWRRPACMTKPLSNDLRERLVSAVDSGLSRRSAARRFGVAASTAIKWVNRWRRTGDVGPRPQGGDHRSHRIEAHAEEILALVDETPDITLGEIAAHLDAGHGLTVAQSTVWRLTRRRTSPWARSRHTWTRGMA